MGGILGSQNARKGKKFSGREVTKGLELAKITKALGGGK